MSRIKRKSMISIQSSSTWRMSSLGNVSQGPPIFTSGIYEKATRECSVR